jgi:putative Ca2+/H+ antiporter (TMEM165/GDT1 family)
VESSVIDSTIDRSDRPNLKAVSSISSSVYLQAESQPEAQLPDPPKQISLGQECRIFLSTFVTIFLAELGDKTQLTTLLMSAESNAPWIVFLGAGSALVATSLVGVWVGHWLSQRISAKTLETATAALLLMIAVLLLWDVVQG